jgi:hypothetical protein
MTKEEKQYQFTVEKQFKIGKKIAKKDKKTNDSKWIPIDPEIKYIIWDWKNFDYKVV